MTNPTSPICYLKMTFRYVSGYTQTEKYDTGGRDARRRASYLRKRGYQVKTWGMGEQVTNVGRIKMTELRVENMTEAQFDALQDDDRITLRVERGV